MQPFLSSFIVRSRKIAILRVFFSSYFFEDRGNFACPVIYCYFYQENESTSQSTMQIIKQAEIREMMIIFTANRATLIQTVILWFRNVTYQWIHWFSLNETFAQNRINEEIMAAGRTEYICSVSLIMYHLGWCYDTPSF